MNVYKSVGTLILVGMLTGCGLLQPKIETRTEYITVPKSLYPDCPKQEFTGSSVGEALEWSTSLYSTYEMCRSDVNVLIDYLESR